MKVRYIKTVIVTTLALAMMILPQFARAEEAVLPSSSAAVECSFLPQEFCTSDIYEFIGNVANWMVGIFGSLFVLAVVISGVQMASAADSPDRLKSAKSRLTNAIVGLVLLISFRAILSLLGIAIGG